MLDKIIQFSIKNKLIVILFVVTLSGFGIYAILNIPVGAVPDITNNQVQVITTSGNLSTQDIEQFITYPVELEMANLPGVKEIRSVSKFGLSVVTIVFEESLGTYLPRQLIQEKIKTAAENIPEGFGMPNPGPITTGLGEIYQYILDVKPGYEDRYSPMELRTIQDWIVKRQLSGIPGVVEVNTWGGYLKQYEISINTALLNSMDITVSEVYDAIEKNNSVVGGAYIEKEDQSYFIRGEGLTKSIEDIESIVVKNFGAGPVCIGDIAKVRFGHANRFGAITANGEGEKVLGQIMMLKDADSREVINAVKERIESLQKSLPEGVYINPILERGELIDKTTFTVSENLILGFLIVLLVVILLLGNIRSGLVVASLIPLSLFFTILMMFIFGIDANLMSLGAIDFGIIIDGAVIIVEFIVIRLSAGKSEITSLSGDERQSMIDKITFTGASKMMNSAIFGQFIILIVFIPILSLTGVEGKMFRPMALAFSFALIGAIILCFTWLPVASSLFLRPVDPNKRTISTRIMDLLHKSYEPVIRWSYNHKKIVLGMALLSLVLTFLQFTRMGGEFVPTLDEGDFVIQPVLKTGTSLSKTIEITTKIEQILIENFPNEVDQIVSRIGAAEVPTDPMSMEESDVIIKLKPKKEWVKTKSKEELADLFKEALSVLPGLEFEFTQPIEMRFNELITGVRSDVAVKIFGEDLDVLNKKANEIKHLIEGVEGAADVIVEKTAGLPQMSVVYKRDKISEYGINIKDINRMLSMGFGGEFAGSIFEGEKRFDLVVRFEKDYRKDIEDIKNMYVDLPNGTQIKLKELADISYTTGPAKISRDNTKRRVVVSINVRNRDLESVVNDIRYILDDRLKLPPGYNLEYGGQFENLQNASRRLMIAVPIALILILIMLHFAFQSLKEALLIFSAIPLATVGGVFLLSLRGLPFSISAGVGFIALFGIAVLNGIVLIEYLKELKEKGITDMRERVMKATKERLRPVMLTASAAALGFLPMAISTSAGAEVQRPLATVVIGGLVTSTMLTMIALPLLYAVFDNVKGFRLKPFGFIRASVMVILFVGLSSGIQGQTTVNEISLEEAIKLAKENNYSYKAACQKVEKERALSGSAFDLGKTNIYYGYDENNVAENGYPLHIVGLEQTFEFPTVYFSRFKQAKINILLAEKEREIREREICKEVSIVYYDILYLMKRIKELESLVDLYSEYIKVSEKRYHAGESNYLEYLNSTAKHKSVLLRTKQAKDELAASYHSLYAWIQTDSIFIVSEQDPDMLLLDSVSMNENPVPEYYGLMLTDARANLSIEHHTILPDFSINLFTGSNPYENSQAYTGYQFGLSVPLIFGSSVSKVKSAKINISIAEDLYSDIRIRLERKSEELRLQSYRYKSAIDAYYETGKQLADELIITAEKNLSIGAIDFLVYSQSIENAVEIKLNYLDNLSGYNSAIIELKYLTQ